MDGADVCSFTATPFSCSWNTKTTGNGSHTYPRHRERRGRQQRRCLRDGDREQRHRRYHRPHGCHHVAGRGQHGFGQRGGDGLATDNVGVVRVELLVDGALTATATSAPFTTRWNTRKAPPGAHVLQVKAYDAAGNCRFSSPITVYTR